MGAAVTTICLVFSLAVAYFLARYISRRWARVAPARHHRPVLVELSAPRLLMAGHPR
jgi:ABC-type spermidine/putrescine transport system permease subunit I